MERTASVPQSPQLSPAVAAAIRSELPAVAEDVIRAVVTQVPAYADAFSGSMGQNIRTAVEIALQGFISLVSEDRGSEAPVPRADAMEGAYQLGRGEARSGRTANALLSAYRIGARSAWQQLSAVALAQGLEASTIAAFAEAVFAYIDELSAASVAGHNDESETAGRVRQRLRERVARQLLTGASITAVTDAAERADWTVPTTLTAVIATQSQVGPLLQLLPGGTLIIPDAPDIEGGSVLMVPDAHGAGRGALLQAVRGRGCVVGPARAWQEVRSSYSRAVRAHGLGLDGDTDQHLAALVLSADPEAVADLRAQALAPLADLRPATAAKLAETLRAWLLHQGRRDDVAASLFVHPQTVRYRMSQVREAYGAALEDPDTVLALTLALGAEDTPPRRT